MTHSVTGHGLPEKDGLFGWETLQLRQNLEALRAAGYLTTIFLTLGSRLSSKADLLSTAQYVP